MTMKKSQKIIICIFILINILIISFFYFNKKASSKSDNYIKLKSNDLYLENNSIEKKIKKAENSIVIIIGDSRFEHIVREKEAYIIPSNFLFIAKSAMEVNWFKKTAINELEKIIGNKGNELTYHVVINMGVNDIQFYRPFDSSIESYLNEYKYLIDKYQEVNFYLLSINPILEKKLKIVQPNNVRTNEDIAKFNKALIRFSNSNRITYCPSNENIDFVTNDGIHYTKETNQKIITYIAQRCIKY